MGSYNSLGDKFPRFEAKSFQAPCFSGINITLHAFAGRRTVNSCAGIGIVVAAPAGESECQGCFVTVRNRLHGRRSRDDSEFGGYRMVVQQGV